MSSVEHKFFIELDCAQLTQKGEGVSGEVYMAQRHHNHSIMVLADGVGSGVKANIAANVIASMAMNYTTNDIPLLHAAQAIIRAFTSDNSVAGDHSSFTIMDIHQAGEVNIVEFENPQYLLLRSDKPIDAQREKVNIPDLPDLYIYKSSFFAELEDRIILFSKGLSESGRMTIQQSAGWGSQGISDFCIPEIAANSDISAHQLCSKIITRAEMNDSFSPKADMSCALIYFRRPRRILIASGPPYNEGRDKSLAQMTATFQGTKLICGGTTAMIISREWDKPIKVELKRDPAGLPPTSKMEGVDLITEGVLTLSKVKALLERLKSNVISEKGTDGIVSRMLLEHDSIYFVVGTGINPKHHDPNLPLELEMRRNLIKQIGDILEKKFMKEVKIDYI